MSTLLSIAELAIHGMGGLIDFLIAHLARLKRDHPVLYKHELDLLRDFICDDEGFAGFLKEHGLELKELKI